MRTKLWMRNLSVSAPARDGALDVPWPLRALLGFLAAAMAAAAGVAIYEYGRDFAGPDRRELVVHNDSWPPQLREAEPPSGIALQALANSYEGELKVQARGAGAADASRCGRWKKRPRA